MILMSIPRFLETNNILSPFSYHNNTWQKKIEKFWLKWLSIFSVLYFLVLSRGPFGAMFLLTSIFIASLWWKWLKTIAMYRYCILLIKLRNYSPLLLEDKTPRNLFHTRDQTQLWKRKHLDIFLTDAKSSSYKCLVSMAICWLWLIVLVLWWCLYCPCCCGNSSYLIFGEEHM